MLLLMGTSVDQGKSERKAFRGDATGSLPRHMIEPYRLWFEFLKTALSDQKMSVDRSLYKDWGDVQKADFDDWWKDHWQSLFAEPAASVSVVGSLEDCQSVLRDEAYALVKVPLNLPSKVRIAELEKVVKAERKNRPRSKAASMKPRFAITAKRTIRRDVLRGMLRLYQFYLEYTRDLEKSAIAYLDWATAWNKKVKEKGWNRPTTYVPPPLRVFVEILREIEHAPTPAAKRLVRRGHPYDKHRGEVRRYVLRAEKIARNVSRGVFPGEFA